MGRKRKADEALESSSRDLLQQWNQYYIDNDFGIGVQCSQCEKWRLTYEFQESKEVPADWNCSMWKISKKKRGNCSIPSNLTEGDFAREEYPPGTVVWAKLNGFDWWPAMIEDCPDTQEYFVTHDNGEDEYHLTFFGATPKRSWIKASRIREFHSSNKPSKRSLTLKKSIELAEEAAELPIKERLKKYSFAVRYKGRWGKLKDKDDISLPPKCSWLKILKKPAEVKSPAKSGNRSVKRNVHLKPSHCVKKRASGLEKKVEMKKQSLDADEDQPSACRGDNSCKARGVVDVVKKEPVDQNHQQSSGDVGVQTSETTVLIRRDIVSHFKCYQSTRVHEYTRGDCTKSIDNSDSNVDDRSEEEDGASADDEGSEDDDRGKQNAEGARNLSIPAPPSGDSDDSRDSFYSPDDEGEEPPFQKVYKEYLEKKYPSFIGKLLSGTAQEKMVTMA